MKKLFLLLIVFSLLSYCSQDSVDDKAAFYWEQTKCSDPWGTTVNDSQSKTKDALISFLAENGISDVQTVSFEYALFNGVSCDACNCKSGINIIVGVKEEYVQKMGELGFKKYLN